MSAVMCLLDYEQSWHRIKMVTARPDEFIQNMMKINYQNVSKIQLKHLAKFSNNRQNHRYID